MSGFINKTIGQVIKDTAWRYPQNLALIHPEFGVRQKYQDFYDDCRKIAMPKGL